MSVSAHFCEGVVCDLLGSLYLTIAEDKLQKIWRYGILAYLLRR